ncbi:hypothetical protein [Marinobacter sp. DY40_1A1]|uniref:hypothetical protein n=1 Tax=Marinobacter sp. DY40_1A1 TaxID=2583229 RepID=UPI0019038379|nr:hypothetical protein [Marinobacter sp. DY40_1A1]MBK1887462.1 hypothetical protein [Marinobacter sp. DY40_1A1]
MSVVITITQVDCRKADIVETVVLSLEAPNEGERFEVTKDNLIIYGGVYEFQLSVSCVNMAMSFSLINESDAVLRYGGVVTGNTHFDVSLGAGQLVEVLLEVK